MANFTRLTAREIAYNNFEISLVVFMPNTTTNQTITYTNHAECLFMCYFSYKAQKNIISRGFNLMSNSWQKPKWRLLLVTSQASSSTTTPKNILHLVKKIKGFPLKVKSFQNTATYQKLLGEVPSTPPPPPPLYHTRGMNLRVRPRDKIPIIPQTLHLS